MSGDDTTRQNRISGEWSSDECRESIRRVEKKLDHLLERHGESITSVAVLEERLKVAEIRYSELVATGKARDDETRTAATSVRIAVVSGISGPLLMIAIHLLTRHA